MVWSVPNLVRVLSSWPKRNWRIAPAWRSRVGFLNFSPCMQHPRRAPRGFDNLPSIGGRCDSLARRDHRKSKFGLRHAVNVQVSPEATIRFPPAFLICIPGISTRVLGYSTYSGVCVHTHSSTVQGGVANASKHNNNNLIPAWILFSNLFSKAVRSLHCGTSTFS
jgi:hypothetical protein